MEGGATQRTVGDRLWIMRERLRARSPLHIAAAIGLFLAGVVVRALIDDLSLAPFLPFYPALLLAAFLCNRTVGYGIAAASLTLVVFVFRPAGTTLDFQALWPIALSFVLFCVLIVEIVALITAALDRAVARARRLAEDSAALAERAEQLDTRLQELQTLYDQAPLGLAFLDPELRFVRINRALAAINGFEVEHHIGRRAWDIVPDLKDAAEPALRQVLDTGEILRDVEVVGTTPARPGEVRHWKEQFYPVVAPDGRIRGIGILCEEVTELRRAQEREQLLVREADHRAKNLLAVVQAIVNLTGGDRIDQYKEALSGRIQAVGRVHSPLASDTGHGVELAKLLQGELEPYGSAAQVTGSGDPVLLKPEAAQSLALVFHELATNAGKYGSLSGKGTLQVSWSGAEGEPDLAFTWLERGGPAPMAAGKPGFGSKLIERSIVRILGGTLDYRMEAEGLSCRFTVPRAAVQA